MSDDEKIAALEAANAEQAAVIRWHETEAKRLRLELGKVRKEERDLRAAKASKAGPFVYDDMMAAMLPPAAYAVDPASRDDAETAVAALKARTREGLAAMRRALPDVPAHEVLAKVTGAYIDAIGRVLAAGDGS